MNSSGYHRRIVVLALILLAPLAYLLLLHGPIPQAKGYHLFADARTCLGVNNFGNVASNIAFLLVGLTGCWWCVARMERASGGARVAWLVFFIGVTLTFAGSSYYHLKPDDDRLVWDRLPMTLAFVGLFAALLSEHIGEGVERGLLWPGLVVGIGSVWWWRYADDLRLYGWVQGAPLLAIPFVVAMFPGRYTHRVYLLYGLGFYALAKALEFYDQALFDVTAQWISGHSLKHLLAAVAPLILLVMLMRRAEQPRYEKT